MHHMESLYISWYFFYLKHILLLFKKIQKNFYYKLVTFLLRLTIFPCMFIMLVAYMHEIKFVWNVLLLLLLLHTQIGKHVEKNSIILIII